MKIQKNIFFGGMGVGSGGSGSGWGVGLGGGQGGCERRIEFLGKFTNILLIILYQLT